VPKTQALPEGMELAVFYQTDANTAVLITSQYVPGTGNQGVIRFSPGSFSPFAIVAVPLNTPSPTPVLSPVAETGNSLQPVLWGLLILSVCGLLAAVKRKEEK